MRCYNFWPKFLGPLKTCNCHHCATADYIHLSPENVSTCTRVHLLFQVENTKETQAECKKLQMLVRTSSKAGRTHNFFSAYFNVRKRVFYSIHQAYDDQTFLNRKTDFWLSNASKLSQPTALQIAAGQQSMTVNK